MADVTDSRGRRQYPQEFQVEAVRLADSVGINAAAARLGVPKATLGNWARRRRKVVEPGEVEATVGQSPRASGPIKRPVSELEAEIARLRRELASQKLDNEIPSKSSGVLREGVAVKYAWIQEHGDSYPVARLCRLLGVSRSGYLQWRVRPPSARSLANADLDAQVAAVHAESSRTYGRPRIQRALQACGVRAGHERIRRSLQRQGLRCVYRRAYRVTTDSDHAHPVAPNTLERRFDGWRPDEAWVADITYVPTAEGWLYLACVLDLATRRIVGWSMSERLKAQLACDALRMAYWRRKPPPGLIAHSDRGSQYASREYRRALSDFRMRQSMSRRANCWDNAPMESFFKTLKVERVDRVRYATRAQARLDIVDWIEGFYNQRRLHSSIGYRTPTEFERKLMAA
ncbi:IS3 family transposase [Piscinibacter koreensis]|uniref:IS3 family transposase n=1 Tax=Piscinibacter koreensis TaxID=2742824 RepID=UPI001C37A60F|nr:IS3 family transposase [Schlegelella koreensis]